MEHIDIPAGEIHVPHNWSYANAAARTAAVITDATLIDRIALQADTNAYYRLTAVSPAVWTLIADQAALTTALALKAPLASPNFTGIVSLTGTFATTTTGSYGTMNTTGNGNLAWMRASAAYGYIGNTASTTGGSTTDFGIRAEGNLVFGAGGFGEDARITVGGNLLIGGTTDDAVNKLQVTGSSKVTGDLSVVAPAAASAIASVDTITDAAHAAIFFKYNGLSRWRIGKVNVSETGSNAGSDFNLARYNDAGTIIDITFSIARATGLATFANGLAVTGTMGVTDLAGAITITATSSAANARNFAIGQIAAFGTINITISAAKGGDPLTGPVLASFNAAGVLLSNNFANYFQLSGAAAASSPVLSAVGSDTNINLNFTPKGTGTVNLNGPAVVTGQMTSTAIANTAPATKTGTTYTVVAADASLIFNTSATHTLTLPAAASFSGRWLYLKNIAAFAINSASSNVVPQAGGAAGTGILAATAGKWAALQSDGTNWQIMMSN